MAKKKSLVLNSIYNALYSLINIILPVITIPYISRVLFAEGVGRVSSAQNIVSYFILFASLGIPSYATREIAKCGNDLEKRSIVFSEIFFINLVCSVITSYVYFYAVCNLEYLAAERNLLIIFGITLVANAFNIDWLYKGIEEFRFITIRNFVIKLVGLVCTLLLVKEEGDIYVYAAILAVSTSANYFLNILGARRHIHIRHISLKQLKKHIKPIIYMFGTALGVELYTQVDITMIRFICGVEFVGYYANSVKLNKMFVTLIAAIGGALMPRLSSYLKENDTDRLNYVVGNTLKFILYISIPAAVGMIMLRTDIVDVFFGANFEPAYFTVGVLSLLIPIMCIGNLFGTQVLIVFDKERFLTLSVFAGALINTTLNSVMIPFWMHNGAAIASVITEFFVMLIQIVIASRCVKINIKLDDILKLAMQVFVMALSIILMKLVVRAAFLSLICGILLGVSVYIASGFALRSPVQKMFVSQAVDMLKKYRGKAN